MGQRLEHFGVVGRIDDDGDVLVVLRRRAQHRRTADVDVLDGLGESAIGLRGDPLERIQVDHQQVDRADAVLGHHGFVDAASAEQAAVHERMQGFDAAVHDLREAGQGADLGDLEFRVTQRSCGAAGRDEPDTECVETAREVGEAGLVGDAQQGAARVDERGVEHRALRILGLVLGRVGVGATRPRRTRVRRIQVRP